MPELPEVENLRRSLEPWLVGSRVVDVEVRRRGVIALPRQTRKTEGVFQSALGAGGVITALRRHGKQLVIEFDDTRALVIQLGMTGSVTLEQGPPPKGMDGRHRHVLWRVETTRSWPVEPSDESTRPRLKSRSDSMCRFVFRDPRRFGGVTAGLAIHQIIDRWRELGPDALTIEPDHLMNSSRGSRRQIKSFLLDQNKIAGVGNIYADECLFASCIHPEQPAGSLTAACWTRLVAELRRILALAVDRGGSTLRDYRDAFGRPGEARQTHRAYGRAGIPCDRCETTLLGTRLLGRATVHCPRCQDLSTSTSVSSDLKPRAARRAGRDVRKSRKPR